MSPWRAMAGKEARQAGAETLVLAAAAGLMPALLALVSDDVRESGAGVVLAAIFTSGAALLLGAGVFSGDPAPAFLASRAIGALPSMSIRVLVRLGSLALVALPALGVSSALAPPDLGRATLLDPRVLAPLLLLAFLTAAASSAFRARVLGAALEGAASSLMVLGAAMVLRDWLPVPVMLAIAVAAHVPLLLVLGRLRADAAFDPARLLERALIVLFALTALACLLHVGLGGRAADARLVESLAHWDRAAGEGAPFVPVPDAPPSADAVRLDALARRIGVALGASWFGEDWRTRRRLPGGVGRELRLESLPIGARPALRDHLRSHDERLAEIRRVAARGDVRWEIRREYPDWDDPDGDGHVVLAQMLGADALLRRSQGDRSAALEDLAAIAGLAEALRSHPSEDSQLAALDVLRVRERAARAIEAPWSPALPEAALLAQLRRAATADVHAHAEVGDTFIPALHVPVLDAAAEWLTAPNRRGRVAREIEKRARELGAWNGDACAALEGPGVLPSPWESARSAGLLLLENELTHVTGEMRAWSRAGAGTAPPADLPVSRICPGRRWTVDVAADRSFTIAPWPALAVPPGELTHREPAP